MGQKAGNGQLAQGNQLLNTAQGQLQPAINNFNTESANGNALAGVWANQFPSIYNQFLNTAGLSGGINPANPNQSIPGGQGPNPYALTAPQQTQLNAQTDQYTAAAQSAIDQYKQAAAQQGIPADPAQIANIQATYAAQAQQGKANFEEQERNTQLTSEGNLLSTLNNMQSTGTGEIQSAGQGLNSVAGTAGSLAGTAYNEASNLNQQALAPLMGLLQLGGYALGGGLGGGGGLSSILKALSGGSSNSGSLANSTGVYEYSSPAGPPAPAISTAAPTLPGLPAVPSASSYSNVFGIPGG